MTLTRRGFLGGMAAAAAAVGLGLKVEETPPKRFSCCGISADEIVATQPMLQEVPDLEISGIYLNGLMLQEGYDYTIGRGDGALVFEVPLQRGDIISCMYRDSEGELTVRMEEAR